MDMLVTNNNLESQNEALKRENNALKNIGIFCKPKFNKKYR